MSEFFCCAGRESGDVNKPAEVIPLRLVTLHLQGKVDELVFLAADQLALPGAAQQLVGGRPVTLRLADGVA
jgi:hypothetical protein